MLCHFRTVEELGDAHVFQQSLPSPCLYHELSGQLGDFAWLKWPHLDRFVERVSRYDRPVRELREDHGLAHRVRPQVRLKAERFDAWDLNFKDGERRPWLCLLEDYMGPSSH